MRPLIDSRMRQAIPDHWPSRCTISVKRYTVSGANETIWDTVTADSIKLNGIECRLGPLVQSRVPDSVRRTDKERTIYHDMECLMNIYATNISEESDFAIVDGQSYYIRGVEWDSQQFMTRLRLEIVT